MPELDRDMLIEFHSASTDLRALADLCEGGGVKLAKAAHYRRIAEMLDGIAYQVRDPLLTEAWEHTGKGPNNKVPRARILERRTMAEMAAYLLIKNEGRRTSDACATVAKATGENVETLRSRFKGLALKDYERSKNGRRTAEMFATIVRLSFPKGATWKQVYDFSIEGASLMKLELQS